MLPTADGVDKSEEDVPEIVLALDLEPKLSFRGFSYIFVRV